MRAALQEGAKMVWKHLGVALRAISYGNRCKPDADRDPPHGQLRVGSDRDHLVAGRGCAKEEFSCEPGPIPETVLRTTSLVSRGVVINGICWLTD
jgi:hypothetical protein